MPFDKAKIPKELIDSFKSGKSSVYVGAGLSIKAGLPTWKNLIIDLIEEVKKLPYDTTKQVEDYLKLIADPSKYLLIAQDIKDSLGKLYFDFLTKRFDNPAIVLTDDYNHLVSLPNNFIITTNYDNLIERAFINVHKNIPVTFTHRQNSEIAYKMWNREFFILKAHGDVRILKEDIIMTERDYRDILFKNPGFQSALQVLFSTNSILFLGTSFSDPDFILLMRYLHSAYHGGGPTHYILINEKDTLDVEAKRYLLDFNLHTIFYNPEKNYVQITEFLDLLLEAVKA